MNKNDKIAELRKEVSGLRGKVWALEDYKSQKEYVPELFPEWWCEMREYDCRKNCVHIQCPTIHSNKWTCHHPAIVGSRHRRV